MSEGRTAPFVSSGITLRVQKSALSSRPVAASLYLLHLPLRRQRSTCIANDLSSTALYLRFSEPIHSFTSLVLLRLNSLTKTTVVFVANAANCNIVSCTARLGKRLDSCLGTYCNYLALCYKSARKRAPCYPHTFRRPGTPFASSILRSPPHYRALLIATRGHCTRFDLHARNARLSLRQSLASVYDTASFQSTCLSSALATPLNDPNDYLT